MQGQKNGVYMDALQRLIHEFSKLPSVGKKTATRLSYHLLNDEEDSSTQLANALLNAKENTCLCEICFNYTESTRCSICSNLGRDRNVIAVVERPCDVEAVESSEQYRGLYHVLHGCLSPMDGIGPEQLKLKELLHRATQFQEKQKTLEFILTLNPSVEGEATSLYIQTMLKPFPTTISRIAYGLPMGGVLEYADKSTIGKAIANRVVCS